MLRSYICSPWFSRTIQLCYSILNNLMDRLSSFNNKSVIIYGQSYTKLSFNIYLFYIYVCEREEEVNNFFFISRS